MLTSHLTALEASAAHSPLSPVFRLPCLDPATNQVKEWQVITYQQFLHDVETSAKYWSSLFASRRIPQRSVIGLWIGGFTYSDILHIYGVSRAGYVPQMFSLRLPNPVIIYSLMQKANAKALIYEPCYATSVVNAPVPTFLAIDKHSMGVPSVPLPVLPCVSDDDFAFIFHTSGSTSGSPKLVPCSYKWLGSAIHKSNIISKPRNLHRRDVTVWMGSLCHIAQSFMFLGTLQHGSCVIQPTKINFSSEELVDMIERCGLNRLNQFATFLSNHLRNSRNDRKLLSKLQGLEEVVFTGLPLPRDDEEWAMKNGVQLRNLFGSTECGATLLAVGGKSRSAPFLRPIDGMSYSFVPIEPSQPERHQTTAMLLELVILAESPDCPHKSLRSDDGHFHTGDLFIQTAPGLYVFRGRNDDWIKTENSLRCDTKAIEDNVKATCGQFVKDCVVVGTGRPSPSIFIEAVDNDTDTNFIKQEIMRKTRRFNSTRYLHEQIASPHFIIVLHQGTLPRTVTKGNIRRKEVETQYKGLLDQLYGQTF
ncbi:hypothetical protein M378DRAFT_66741 [Amanita muscaria Koide BX008]|uniref:AMP-dependent synthetase/ligase domain-containing protein n=1 Tax=Amanita muscaria (strain Koide BX008) TaxID=946122 RepID=A0A0C2XNI8_AMAMK|nr:hypothetical protein M378DRAFT_66741 [Amanita muscaria Koide BX008]